MGEAGLDQPALAFVGDELVHDGSQLVAGAGRLLLLHDPGARPDHLGQRPVRHAFSIRQATALVPADEPLDPVDVLEELPQQPRLAKTRVSAHRHKLSLAPFGGLLERLKHVRELAFAADERGLEPGAASSATGARDDPQRGPRPHRLLAPLDRVLARVLIGDRRL